MNISENEVLKCIKKRRSVRAFLTDKDIPKEELLAIAQAGHFAPTGRNNQLTKFTVIQNQDLIKDFADRIKRVLDREEGYNFYGPNALIIVSQPKDNPHRVEDCACALENIFLAATALGIGSVWINQAKDICDEAEIRDFLNKVKIPKEHNIYGMAALGYEKGETKFVERKYDAIEWID